MEVMAWRSHTHLEFLLYRTQGKMQSSPELYVYTCGPVWSRDYTAVHLQGTFTSTVLSGLKAFLGKRQSFKVP